MKKSTSLILGFALTFSSVSVSANLTNTPIYAEVDDGVTIVNSYDSYIQTEELIKNRPLMFRQMESLDRGLVAAKTDNGAFLSWRWLATEPVNMLFNVYRGNEKITTFPINATNFTDTIGTVNTKYYVTGVIDGVEVDKSKEVTPTQNPYLAIPLKRPAPGRTPGGQAYEYRANDCSVGDVDGDGEYEIILKWDPTNQKDNSQYGYTGNVYIDAYKLSGKHLWRIDLGKNIRAGAHYTQFMVYDLDGDGKTEVVCKTADGTRDGKGSLIGSAGIDYRNGNGYIIQGPEYLTVFDGETGEAMHTIDYSPPRIDAGAWGDSYGNRVDRFLACIAYLDGIHPSVVMCRGYYGRSVLAAYNYVDKELEEVWTFDTDDEEYKTYAGQGNHNLSVGDVDFDGCDEIIYGAMAVDHNGQGLYNTGLGHGDAMHLGDFNPDRPGLEVFDVHESSGAEYGLEFRDAKTGEVLWGMHTGSDNGRGAADDVDPRYPGAESWSAGYMWSAKGQAIVKSPKIAQNSFAWWDGDLGREVLDNTTISKWNWEISATEPLLTAKECVSNNSTKVNACLSVDLYGDWREEVIWRNKDSSELHIYTTAIPTEYKIYTLMHDPVYRLGIAWQNVAYNQPPHTGFYLGYHMEKLPIPMVYTEKNGKRTETGIADPSQFYNMDDLKRNSSIILKMGNCHAIVKDVVKLIDDENSEVTPVLANGRTYLPLRFVSEALEAEVLWDNLKQEITVSKDNVKMIFTINKDSYVINGQRKAMDAPPFIDNGRTMVPIRAIAEEFKMNILWDDSGLIVLSEKETEKNYEVVKRLNEQIDSALTIEEAGGHIADNKLRPNQFKIVSCTVDEDETGAAKLFDGDIDSSWTGKMNPTSFIMDLGNEKIIDGFAAAFINAKYSRVYKFNISVSSDGEKWETVINEGKNIRKIETLEDFKIQQITARYVKFEGLGNTDDKTTGIYEFLILGDEKEDEFEEQEEAGIMSITMGNTSDTPYGTQFKVVNAEASDSPEPFNTPDKAIDGNENTRWSSKGNQWIVFDLEDIKEIYSFGVLNYRSDMRSQIFDVEVSSDKVNWRKICEGYSSGTNTDIEYYYFTEANVKYIRLNMYGNTENEWNTISEFEVYGRGK